MTWLVDVNGFEPATFFGCPISGFSDPSFHPDPSVPADDPRAMIAVARMNYLHSLHRIVSVTQLVLVKLVLSLYIIAQRGLSLHSFLVRFDAQCGSILWQGFKLAIIH